MTEVRTEQATMSKEECEAVVRNAERIALLTMFNQLNEIGRGLLLMKAEGLNDGQMYRKDTIEEA